MLINPKFSRQRMTAGSWGAVPDRGDGGLSDASFQKTLQIMRQDGHAKFRVESGTYWLSQGLDIDIDDAEFICPDGVATIYQTSYGKNVARLIGDRVRVRNLDLRNPVTKTPITNGNVTQRYLGEFRRQEACGLVIQGLDPVIENVITRNFIAGLRWIGGKERYYEAAAFGGSMTTTTLQLNEAQRRSTGYWVGARFKAFGTTGGTWADLVLVTAYDGTTNTITWAVPQTVPSGAVWLFLVKDPSDGGVVNNHRSYSEDFGRIMSFVKDLEFAGLIYTNGIVNSQGPPPHAIYGTGSFDGTDDTSSAEPDIAPPMPAVDQMLVSGQVITVNPTPLVVGDGYMAIKYRNCRRVIIQKEALAIGTRGCLYLQLVDYYSGSSKILDAKTNSTNNRPSALEMYDVRRSDWKAHMEMASDYVWGGTQSSLPAVVVVESSGLGRAPADCVGEISGVFRGTSQTVQQGILALSTANPAIGNINIRKMNLRAENSLAITAARIFNTKRVTIGPEVDLINVDPSTLAQLSVQSKVIFEATCEAGLVDYQSARTAGVIAVTDLGASDVTTTANLVRDRSTEGARTLLSNGDFDAWDAGTSFSLAANTLTTVANNWKAWRGQTGGVVSQQAGIAGSRFAPRLQRTVSTVGTMGLFLASDKLAPKLVRALAGKEITLLIAARRGADFSASSAQIRTALMYGTGVDEDYTTSGFPTGSGVTSNQNICLGTSMRWCAVRLTVPAGATNMALRFEFRPVGTAGADDWCEIGPVALIAGASSKQFSALV